MLYAAASEWLHYTSTRYDHCQSCH